MSPLEAAPILGRSQRPPAAVVLAVAVADRSIGATFDFFREMYGAPAKVFSGPEKSRGVDFSRQTYSKRYDFFDSFRAARSMEASARRSISLREINGAPAKNSSGPENRDASILLGKHIANAMIFSTVFDRNRSRHREVAKWAGLAGLAHHPRLIFIKEHSSDRFRIRASNRCSPPAGDHGARLVREDPRA